MKQEKSKRKQSRLQVGFEPVSSRSSSSGGGAGVEWLTAEATVIFQKLLGVQVRVLQVLGNLDRYISSLGDLNDSTVVHFYSREKSS